jgi:hypothetical protein
MRLLSLSPSSSSSSELIWNWNERQATTGNTTPEQNRGTQETTEMTICKDKRQEEW